MRQVFIFFAVITMHYGFGQCPFQVQLSSKRNSCLPDDTLVVSTLQTISSITWLYNNIPDKTVMASVVNKPLANTVTVAGGNGAGASLNQFNSPSSVFVDDVGYVYIADRSNFRVMRFSPGSTSATDGVIIAGGNGPGKALNQLQPNAICIDADGNLYVADDANSRVLKFPPNSSGSTNGTIVAGGNGAGKTADQLVNPVSVFVDVSKNLYVVDAFNDRVQKFPPNSTSNTGAITVAGGNDYGSKANQFNGPAAVFVDKDGYIYVDDAANNRIQKFPPNSTSATNGVTIAGGNGFGVAENQLATPFSIWGDDDGNIYVADINNERIQLFPPGSNTSTPGKTVAGGNGQGLAANQFSGPNSVWGDNKGNLFVSDVGNNRIQKFSMQVVKQYVIDTTFIARITDTYTAVITDTSGCKMTSNNIVINPNIVPAISITSVSNNITPCAQTKADFSFIAKAINGGALPVYQWKINGIDTGKNTSSFAASLTNGDVVSCMLAGNAVCTVPATVLSNTIVVSFASQLVAALKNKGRLCAGMDTLTVTSDNLIASIAWYQENRKDTIINAGNAIVIDTSYQPSLAGNYKAIVTDVSGCTDTTNVIAISTTIKPTISISTDKEKVCAGAPLLFMAISANTGSSPVYQWRINDIAAGLEGSHFTASSLHDNDFVDCVIYGDATACFGNDTSNTIVPVIKPLPVFENTNDVSISLGQSITLSPSVTGAIIAYTWQPTSTLSNPFVAYPVATPLKTTDYILHVLSSDSCVAVDSIKVVVSSPVLIPGAFSPNGDGLNDVWYVLGGREGDEIKKMAVFNRQGQAVFLANNILLDDRKQGWDGTYKGRLQSTGTYIYEVVIASADNSRITYKGTLVLIK